MRRRYEAEGIRYEAEEEGGCPPSKKLKQMELNFKKVLERDNTKELANENEIENHETSGTDETTNDILDIISAPIMDTEAQVINNTHET